MLEEEGFFFLGGARGWTGATYADEVIVQSKGHQRLWQLSHVQLDHVGNDVGMDISQVDQLSSVLKCLTQFLHFTLDPAYSVDSFD